MLADPAAALVDVLQRLFALQVLDLMRVQQVFFNGKADLIQVRQVLRRQFSKVMRLSMFALSLVVW